MNKMILALGFVVALPAGAKPQTKAAAVQSCVKAREQALTCKEPFIEAMMDLRARHQPNIAEAVKADRAKVRAKGLEEMALDGGGPLAERTALCEQAVGDRPPPDEREQKALEACYGKTKCDEKVACMVSIMERIMWPAK